MKKKEKVFIGVAWPYVNGTLHIGHLAGYLLPSDIFARYQRLKHKEVLMVSGSDCYGTPITIEADKEGVQPQEIVNRYHLKHKNLLKKIGISFDLYTTTTTKEHSETVHDIFLDCLKKGYIFKDSSEQFFDEKGNRFLPDRYVEGTCPFCSSPSIRSDQCDECNRVLEQSQLINPVSKLTKNKVVLKSTEHYFFNWQKGEDFLTQYLNSRKQWKDWVLNESLDWLTRGLKPRSITRDIDWGITLPTEQIPNELQLKDAENKRIYVWFEAVIGYLSASKRWSKQGEWKAFWQNEYSKHVYFMGKDNLVFHTLFWPIQLNAFDSSLNLPDIVNINQFLTFGDKRFSKSRGTVIDSDYIVSKYGVDPVRFYLTTITPEKADSSFTWRDFIHNHNGVLIGNIGNFINRVLSLAVNVTLDPSKLDPEIQLAVKKYVSTATESIGICSTRGYVESIINLSNFGNKYIAGKEPWKLESESKQYIQVLTNAIFILLNITTLLKPVIPSSIKQIESFLKIKISGIDDDLEKQVIQILSSIHIQDKSKPLFKKIEEENIALESKREMS